MATFIELTADVMTLTNRPDLVNETSLAVRAATLKVHHKDFFPKDLYELSLSWSDPAFIQSLDYRLLIPRWRSFKYLRKYDNSVTPGVPGAFFKMLTPEQVLDRYDIQKDNICYLAGTQLEIRSNTEDDYMLLGCYLHPDTAPASYTSWVALDHPWLIVFEAAKILFKTIGKDEENAAFTRELAEQYQALNSEILGKGE